MAGEGFNHSSAKQYWEEDYTKTEPPQAQTLTAAAAFQRV